MLICGSKTRVWETHSVQARDLLLFFSKNNKMRLKEDQYAQDIKENPADRSCWDCARSWDLSLRWSSGFIQKSCMITKWKLCRTADLWGEHYLLSDPKASLSSSRYSCWSHRFFCSDGNWIGILYPGSCLTSTVRKVPWGCLWKNATVALVALQLMLELLW